MVNNLKAIKSPMTKAAVPILKPKNLL
jgi:hypothetical protein